METSKTFEHIIFEINDQWKFHATEAEKFKRLLDLAASQNEVLTVNSIQPLTMPTFPLSKAIVPNKNRKRTFEEVVVNILKDKGAPMYNLELLAAYFEITGIEFNIRGFSSRMALVAKYKGTIRNQEFRELPITHRFWFGLLDWFDGNEFKEEFKEKIMIKADRLKAA